MRQGYLSTWPNLLPKPKTLLQEYLKARYIIYHGAFKQSSIYKLLPPHTIGSHLFKCQQTMSIRFTKQHVHYDLQHLIV